MSEPDSPAGDPVRIGPYHVLGVLGRGGSAVVYRAARDDQPPVALKVCPVARQPENERQMQREVRLLTSLAHPGVVRLHEAGHEGDLLDYSMDLMEGGSLADRLTATPLPWREALRVLMPALEGLAYLHARGVTHRDLKPLNILFDGAGACRISDPGLAVAAGYTTITAEGSIIGTLRYMAPEILRAERATPRSDVCQMGLILIRMIAGFHPIRATTPPQIIQEALAGNRASLASEVPDLPGELDVLLEFCLSIDPLVRPREGGDLVKRLRGILGGEESPAPADPAPAPAPVVIPVTIPPLPAAMPRGANRLVAPGLGITVLLLLLLLRGLRDPGASTGPSPVTSVTPPAATPRPAAARLRLDNGLLIAQNVDDSVTIRAKGRVAGTGRVACGESIPSGDHQFTLLAGPAPAVSSPASATVDPGTGLAEIPPDMREIEALLFLAHRFEALSTRESLLERL